MCILEKGPNFGISGDQPKVHRLLEGPKFPRFTPFQLAHVMSFLSWLQHFKSTVNVLQIFFFCFVKRIIHFYELK